MNILKKAFLKPSLSSEIKYFKLIKPTMSGFLVRSLSCSKNITSFIIPYTKFNSKGTINKNFIKNSIRNFSQNESKLSI
jgi:hypothetical protein